MSGADLVAFFLFAAFGWHAADGNALAAAVCFVIAIIFGLKSACDRAPDLPDDSD